METIQEYLHAHGIQESDLILDGTMQSIKTDSFKGWYIGDDLGGGKRRITIEDWRTRNRQTLSEGFVGTDEEKEQLDASRKKFDEEKIAMQKQKKKESQIAIQEFIELAKKWNKHSKYLSKKGISNSFGAIQIQSNMIGTDLIIPMQDASGSTWNYQIIDESGFKTFQPGALADGLWFELKSLSPQQDAGLILICEGFATACSVQMAVPHARVFCAFSSGNLSLVAVELRRLHNYAHIIICGDDDYKLDENAGRLAAEEAAKLCNGSTVYPVFSSVRGKNWTDFNDLMCAPQYGLDVVSAQLQAAVTRSLPPSKEWIETMQKAAEIEQKPTKIAQKIAEKLKTIADSGNAIIPYINGVAPMPMRTNKQGQPILPSEFEAAAALMKYYEGRCVISEECLFIYDKTHWREMDSYNISQLKVQIQVLYNGLSPNSRLENTYKQFINIVPKSPRNLFIPNCQIVNFTNGTLHVVQTKGKWTFDFKPHNKFDYCTNVIPIEYDVTRKIKNKEFEEMIDRILKSAPDADEKLRAIKQMYGACIAPIFPHLFLLFGPAGSGKTSLIIPAQRLVHESNWSSVEPHEFSGFLMESMAGKLVNFVTDISLTERIRDEKVKLIEDRIPIRIDRKFKVAIKAPLPTIHIFGGNGLPQTYDKGSKAHERRWTMLEIKGLVAAGSYEKFFSERVFEDCPQGVLNFALDGLQDLLDSKGHYFVPKSSKEAMDKFLGDSDAVAQFLNDMENGEDFGLALDPKGRVKRSDLWPIFSQWHRSFYDGAAFKGGKHRFLDAICKAELPGQNFDGLRTALIKTDGEWHFCGLRKTEGVIPVRGQIGQGSLP